MDEFGREAYAELAKVQHGPAVSIFMQADRQDNKGKNNQLLFRAQFDQAKKILAERYPEGDHRELIAKMEARLKDTQLWGSVTRGVAGFFSAEVDEVYRLDADVQPEAVVSETFHTRPMLRALAHPRHYWVLILDPKQTKLFEVTGRRIEQVDMGKIPTNIEEALSQDYPPLQQAARGTGAGLSNQFQHGTGPGRDVRPELLRQFAQIIDNGLFDLLQGNKDPIFLCGLEQISAQYRAVSKLPHLNKEGLVESLVHLTPNQILAKTRPLALLTVEQRIQELLDLWEREYGRGQGETDLQQIARRTVMSQVRYLLIEQGRRIWGELDRNAGSIAVRAADGQNDGPSAHTHADLLDELAEFVLSRGGEVYVLPKDKMPCDTGAAAMLRTAAATGTPS